MSTSSVHATFRLIGSFDLESVSARLDLVPSRTFSEGDLAGRGVSGRRHDHSGWILDSSTRVEAVDLAGPHLEWLLDRLRGNGEALRDLMDAGVNADVTCVWSGSGSGGGPVFTPEHLRDLADLGLPLVVACYTDQS